MTIKVFILEHSVALITVLVLRTILTLLKQVVIQTLDLDDLFTLPTCRQHWALFPIVDINRFFVEVLIILSTEVAAFFVNGRRIFIILILLHL